MKSNRFDIPKRWFWFSGLYLLPITSILLVMIYQIIHLNWLFFLILLFLPSLMICCININWKTKYNLSKFDLLSLLKFVKQLPSKEKQKAMYPDIPERWLSKKVDGIVLGKQNNKFVRYQVDNNNILHACLLGGPGSGKSSTMLISMISNFMKLNHELTYMAVDIKPELALKSVNIYEDESVRVINPTEAYGPGWNAYFMIDETSSDDDVLDTLDNIARSLIISSSPTDRFFVEGAVKIFKGLMLYGFRQHKDFVTSIEDILAANVQERIIEILHDEDLISCHPKIRFLLSEYEGVDSEAFDDLSIEMKMPLSIFFNDSVRYTFKDAAIKATPKDLDNRTSIFLAMPESKLEQFAGLFRMMLYQTLAYMETRKESSNPVVMFIDEFARLGKIEKIVNALATLRSRRVSIWMAFQDLSQLEKSYGYEWARSIWNLCSIHEILSCSDIKTNEMLSKMAGHYTEIKKTQNVKRFELTAENNSYSDIDKPVLEISDIAELRDRKEAIIFLENKYYRAKKTAYFEVKELVEYSDKVKEINETNSLFRW